MAAMLQVQLFRLMITIIFLLTCSFILYEYGFFVCSQVVLSFFIVYKPCCILPDMYDPFPSMRHNVHA